MKIRALFIPSLIMILLISISGCINNESPEDESKSWDSGVVISLITGLGN